MNESIIRITGMVFAFGALTLMLYAAHEARVGPLLGSLFLAIIAIELIGGTYTKTETPSADPHADSYADQGSDPWE